MERRAFLMNALKLGAPLVAVGLLTPAAAQRRRLGGREAQPAMWAAQDDLEDALECLESAKSNKGGHRKEAIELVRKAQRNIRQGIRYDSNRGREQRTSVFRRFPDLDRRRNDDNSMMREAKRQLEAAKTDLRRATADKGGNRREAMELIDKAIREIDKGIDFARDN